MATKIVTKNSSTASAVPTASDLVQGELAVNVADKRLFTEDNAGAIVELGTNPSGNVTFQDNGKAIFGAGSDLQIYHDGLNSYIVDAGTGDLYFRSASNLYIGNAAGTQSYITAADGGAVDLRYNGAAKLATTSTGIDVIGSVTADGLTVTGTNANLVLGTSGNDITFNRNADNYINASGGTSSNIIINPQNRFVVNTGGSERMRIDSAGRVGIGVTPSSGIQLEVGNSTNSSAVSRVTNGTVSVDLTASSSGKVFLEVGTNHPLIFATNATERMRIDSSGNVGIGTSSPATTLTVEGSGANGIELNRNGADATQSARLFFDSSTSGYAVTNVAGALTFNSGATAGSSSGTERMRIDSSGNVGIGTSSPGVKLDVISSNQVVSNFAHPSTSTAAVNGGAMVRIQNTNATNGNQSSLVFADSTASASSGIFGYNTNHSTHEGYMVFGTRNSGGSFAERMRIDSSGNLLVGGTSAFGADTITLGTGGFAGIRNTSGSCLELRRDSTDGSILDFQKDGSTVGSIGYGGGAILYNAASNYGLKFYDAGGANIIHPATTAGGDLDGSVDLGYAGARFKDLYLSGGVYLGGTGSANKLDDYEEGTFTAALTADTGTITLSNGLMRYTKIGRVVTVSGLIICSAISSPTGDISLTGLPFVVNNNTDGVYSGLSTGSIHIQGLASTITGNPQLNIPNNGTIIDIDGFNGTTRTSIAANISATTQIRICATYTT